MSPSLESAEERGSNSTSEVLLNNCTLAPQTSVLACWIAIRQGQNEFENMPATLEASEEERAKFPNPVDLQQECLGVISRSQVSSSA